MLCGEKKKLLVLWRQSPNNNNSNNNRPSFSFYFSFFFPFIFVFPYPSLSVAFARSFLWTKPRSGSCSALVRSPGTLRSHYNSTLIKFVVVYFASHNRFPLSRAVEDVSRWLLHACAPLNSRLIKIHEVQFQWELRAFYLLKFIFQRTIWSPCACTMALPQESCPRNGGVVWRQWSSHLAPRATSRGRQIACPLPRIWRLRMRIRGEVSVGVCTDVGGAEGEVVMVEEEALKRRILYVLKGRSF